MSIFDSLDQFLLREGRRKMDDVGISSSFEGIDRALVDAFKEYHFELFFWE